RLRDGRGGAAGGCRRPGGRGRGDLPRRGHGAPRTAPPVERGVAPLAQGGAARPSGRVPPSRDDARAGPGPGRSPPGGHAGGADAGPVGEGVAQSRGIPLEVRDHAVRDADGGGVGADRLRVRPGRRCRARRRVRARGASWARVHLPRGRRGRTGLDPRGVARLRGPANRARDATGRGPGSARLRGGTQDPARDVSQLERPYPHRGGARGPPVQALPRPGGRRHPQHRWPADGRHLPHRRVLPRPCGVGTQPAGPRARGARQLRERVSPGVREGRLDLTRAERAGGSLMPVRRTVLAFAVTFVCALAVFTLPRFAWNTLHGAVRQQPQAAETTATAAALAPQAAPRSLPQRLTGLFGILLILGIGFALSRDRRAISWRVVAWGVGLQLAFAIFVLRVPLGQTLFR